MPSQKVKTKLWVFKTPLEKCHEAATIMHNQYRNKFISGVEYFKVLDALNERMIEIQDKENIAHKLGLDKEL